MDFLGAMVEFFQKYPQWAILAVVLWCWLLKEIFQAYFKAALLISILVGALIGAIYSMRDGKALGFLRMEKGISPSGPGAQV